MSLSGTDIAAIITAVTPIVTAIVGVVQFVMMRAQNTKLDSHSADITEIKATLASVNAATGQQRTLNEAEIQRIETALGKP